MTIPATREEASNLELIVDRLISATMPFIGFLQASTSKPMNATGVVVSAPTAPGGVVVLTAGHVKNNLSPMGSIDFFVPANDGESEVTRTPIYLREIHKELDVATFEFREKAPTLSWNGFVPPCKDKACFSAGFRSNFVEWRSESEVILGRSAFFLRTISDGPVAQLSLDGRAQPGNLFGLSGSPVWQLEVNHTKNGIALSLIGLIKGGDQNFITLHSVEHLNIDGTWKS